MSDAHPDAIQQRKVNPETRWDQLQTLILRHEDDGKGAVKLWLKIPDALRDKEAEHITSTLQQFITPAFNGSMANVTIGTETETITTHPDANRPPLKAQAIPLTLKKGAATLYREQTARMEAERAEQATGIFLN